MKWICGSLKPRNVRFDSIPYAGGRCGSNLSRGDEETWNSLVLFTIESIQTTLSCF
jgi:hypothetical protein